MAAINQKKPFKDPRLLHHIDALYNWKHGNHFSPVFVEISPVSYCNQKCKFCYTMELMTPKEKIPDEALYSIVDGLVEAGVKGLRFQGVGEPTLHTGLPKAINMAGSRDLSVSLTTNGVLLTPDFQDKCLENLFSLKVSVIDSDAKRYTKFHRGPEAQWKRVVDNVKYAANLKAKNGLDCIIHTTIYIEESNYKDLKGIVRFCKDIGFNVVTISHATYSERTPTPGLSTNEKYHGEEFLKNLSSEIQSLEDDSFTVNIALLETGGITVVGEKDQKNVFSDVYRFVDETQKIHCEGIHFFTIIDANGFVYPCWRYWGNTDYAYGNVIEQSFDEVWRSNRRHEINAKMKTECYSKKTCEVCAHSRINEQLLRIEKDNNPWVNFLT